MRRGVIPKVGADVAHTEPAFAGLQLLRVLIWGFVKHIDLAWKKWQLLEVH